MCGGMNRCARRPRTPQPEGSAEPVGLRVGQALGERPGRVFFPQSLFGHGLRSAVARWPNTDGTSEVMVPIPSVDSNHPKNSRWATRGQCKAQVRTGERASRPAFHGRDKSTERESNPQLQLGKLPCCRYTTGALRGGTPRRRLPRRSGPKDRLTMTYHQAGDKCTSSTGERQGPGSPCPT
jgi:hypothetical protein